MHKNFFLPAVILLVLFTSCSVSKNYNPDKKYSPRQLKQDYTLLRNILEKKHPSLYWYTSKDSMNLFFDKGYQSITDSMTELQFGWNVLAPLITKIRCGHTSFSMSKGWYRFIDKKHIQIPSFPLYLKIWNDTMVVTGNLSRKDSTIKKGTLITSINGMRAYEMIHQMFNYLSLDGYSDNVNYIRISSNFPFYHRNVFGLFNNYIVGYIDSTGEEKYTLLHMYVPDSNSIKGKMDSTFKVLTRHKYRKQIVQNDRSFSIDSSINTAVMTLNTFSKGGRRHLRAFFRRSFKEIKKDSIHNFVLDLRSNGGGDIDMFVLLAKYLRNTPFKVSDSSYAVAKSLKPYTKYINNGFFNNIGLLFLTHKGKDGNHHYGYWERHLFHPKKSKFFNGKIYVLINGSTFSASTLFCNAVKGQSNIKLVGEETGGGWYGNNGLMIPDITLPITKLRVRLPIFKIVQYHHIDLKGTGVMPDIFIPPTVEGVRKSIDRKMLIVKGMIKQDSLKR
jgi:hypothetical protein